MWSERAAHAAARTYEREDDMRCTVITTGILAVAAVCGTAGASSHQVANPLQRTRRDVETMACHMVFDLDDRYRAHGRALLGLDSRSRWH